MSQQVLNTVVPAITKQDGTSGHLMVVLVASAHGGGRAVYMGLVDIGPDTTPPERAVAAEWVSAFGVKLSFATAQGYFPNIHRANYMA